MPFSTITYMLLAATPLMFFLYFFAAITPDLDIAAIIIIYRRDECAASLRRCCRLPPAAYILPFLSHMPFLRHYLSYYAHYHYMLPSVDAHISGDGFIRLRRLIRFAELLPPYIIIYY